MIDRVAPSRRPDEPAAGEAFAMLDVRPKYLPRFASFDFLETNVRAYVLHDRTPGVYFFSLEAQSWLAVAAARATFGLPYFPAKMSMRRDGDVVDYETRRRMGPAAHSRFRYRVGEALGASQVGTLEHFLVERYFRFVERAQRIEVHDELVGAAGIPQPEGMPRQVHWSPGVDVEVFAPRISSGSAYAR